MRHLDALRPLRATRLMRTACTRSFTTGKQAIDVDAVGKQLHLRGTKTGGSAGRDRLGIVQRLPAHLRHVARRSRASPNWWPHPCLATRAPPWSVACTPRSVTSKKRAVAALPRLGMTVAAGVADKAAQGGRPGRPPKAAKPLSPTEEAASKLACPGTESNRRHGDFQSCPPNRETWGVSILTDE
jgi:hypothetical protein